MSVKSTKLSKLLDRIHDCLRSGDFFDTVHASTRRGERGITRPEMLYVLLHGWHEKGKDEYQKRFDTWNYAVRGKTVDGRELRVVVSFDDSGLLIITAIDLDV